MPLDDDRHDEQSDALEKIDKVIALLAIEDKWCKFFAETSDRRRCLWEPCGWRTPRASSTSRFSRRSGR